MEFLNRLVVKDTDTTVKVSGGGSGSGGNTEVVNGNYLPATMTEEGKYIVDLSNVLFTGNIQAQGEITAFLPDNTNPQSVKDLLQRLTEVFEFKGDKLVIKQDVEYTGKLEKTEIEDNIDNPSLEP